MAHPTILYVEDDPDDEYLLRRGLEIVGVNVALHRVGSVRAAKAYLTATAPYDDQKQFQRPELVITDLSGHDIEGAGIDLVRWIRDTPQLQSMKVICSTGNDDPRHRDAFAALDVVCYTKTHNMRPLVDAIRRELKLD